MIKIFFKNSFIYTIGTVLTKGMAILLVPIYTRYLSPSEYGVIDLFVILASLISLTIALEIHQAVVRFYQDTTNEKDRTEYVSTAFIFTVIIYSFYLLVSVVFAENFTLLLLDNLMYKDLFILASIAIFTKGLFYFTQGQLKWQIMPKESTVVSIINAILVASIAIYLLVVQNMKVESIFIGQIVGNTIGILISMYYAKKSYKFIFIYEKFKEMLSFSTPLVLSGIAIFIALFIDRIAIKHFLDLHDLGIYGIAYRFASITSLVMIGFQSSLAPLIYKHYKEEETPKNIAKLFNIFLVFALFVIGGSILFSNEVLILFTTRSFYAAANIIPLLVIAIFLTNAYIFFPGLAIAKKTKLIASISIVGAVLNTSLNIMFIPLIGVEGAAYATLFSAFVIFIIQTIYSHKYYPISILWIRNTSMLILIVSGAYIINNLFSNITYFSIISKAFVLLLLTVVAIKILLNISPSKINQHIGKQK